MKLIWLVTHGLGDWYLPLSLIPKFIQQHEISKLDLYVDSIYFAQTNYPLQKETGSKMLSSISPKWAAVPSEYFGSDDWHGIPNRYLGPQYTDIKHDFLFYRRQQLKDYIRNLLTKETEPFRFICGTGIWSYEWDGNENIPVDFSGRTSLKFELPRNLGYLHNLVHQNAVLIHLRKKSAYTDDDYFNQIISYCHSKGKYTILIGLKQEVAVDKSAMVIDLRMETITPEEIFYLIENMKYMITSSSVYTWHRFNFNLPTIVTIPETSGYGYCVKENAFLPEDLHNPQYKFYNASEPHLDALTQDIDKWEG